MAKTYYDAHGNLNMPGNHTVDGVWIAKWLNGQKQIYQGKRSGEATLRINGENGNRAERPESIGIQWINRPDGTENADKKSRSSQNV